MKRHQTVLATVAMTFLASSPLATAKGCNGVDTMGNKISCREIDKAYLKTKYCLQPEDFDVRSVAATPGGQNPWSTFHDNTTMKIDLDKISPGAWAPSPTACGKTTVDFTGTQLAITENSGSYTAELSGNITKSMTMSAEPSGGEEIWLHGQDPSDKNMNYYVFFRNGFKATGGANLPKYLYIEVLDLSDSNCLTKVPLKNETVIAGACHQTPAPKKVPQKLHPLNGKWVETGVGGGGEGHH